MLLLALVTSAAALSFSRPIHAARLREAISQIQWSGSAARQDARQFNEPVKLVIDPDQGTLERFEAQQLQSRTTLPLGVRIEQVIVGRRSYWEDRAEIDFSSFGLSESYGIHLKGQGLDHWVFVAGLSGQVTVIHDEQTLRSILDGESPPAGHDAD